MTKDKTMFQHREKDLFPSQQVKKQKLVNLHEIFVDINLILFIHIDQVCQDNYYLFSTFPSYWLMLDISPVLTRGHHYLEYVHILPHFFSCANCSFSGKRQRENDEDMIPTSENYRPEDALEHVQDSKATDLPESFTVKKLREGDYVDVGNIVSSSNIFADRVRRLSCINSFSKIVYNHLLSMS